MALFRELKAKKARYGFTASVDEVTLLQFGLFIDAVFGDQPQSMETWYIDFQSNYGAGRLNVYINDDACYKKFADVNKIWRY